MPALTADPKAQVSLRTWIGVLATLLGGFMAILDIQIVNASLDDITGALGASLDEGSWVSTAYLMAEIVVIPLTGWLSQVVSLRRYLLVNTALFLVFSIACGLAHSLGEMIAFRAVQGFTGGVLIPTSFTVVSTLLPPAKRPIGFALFAISATLAPSLGPTVGGWLTDNYGWEYIFFLNVVPGLLLMAGVLYGLPVSPPRPDLFKNGDWAGILTMAVGLSSLEFVLEEGNRKDWFGSAQIQHAALTSAIFLPIFLIIQLQRSRPLLNLRLLGRRNFGLAVLEAFGIGFGLYGSTFILPLYLAEVQGYDAMQIGLTIMWAGVPQLFITPFIPRLMSHFDLRLLVAAGFALFSISAFMNTTMTEYTGVVELIPAQLVRAMGQPLILTPLSSFATAGIEPQQIGSASSLYNMARNLGGAVGISVLDTLESVRERFHSARLMDAVSLFNPNTQERIHQLNNFLTSHSTLASPIQSQVYALIDNTVRRQSTIMAYNDCFFVMGCVLFGCAFLSLFLTKVKPGAGGPVH